MKEIIFEWIVNQNFSCDYRVLMVKSNIKYTSNLQVYA